MSCPRPGPKLSCFPHSPAQRGLHPNCLYSCLDKHLLCEVSRPLAAFPLCSTRVHGSHQCMKQACTDSIAVIGVSFQVIRSARGHVFECCCSIRKLLFQNLMSIVGEDFQINSMICWTICWFLMYCKAYILYLLLLVCLSRDC